MGEAHYHVVGEAHYYAKRGVVAKQKLYARKILVLEAPYHVVGEAHYYAKRSSSCKTKIVR